MSKNFFSVCGQSATSLPASGARRVLALLTIFLVLAGSFSLARSAENPAPTVPPARTDETNSQELRTYLQLQEQLHATQLAIERTRKESEESARADTQALDARLQLIERSLATQRARELEAMQSSNKVMIIVAGSFAGIGLIAMLLMAYFQWRTINRLAEISAGLPAAGLLGGGRAMAALGPGNARFVTAGPDERAYQVMDAVERLQKRILELEHNATSANGSHAGDAEKSTASDANGEPATESPATPASRITVLLAKGQALLNLDKAEESLVCFDEALRLNAHHAEALVKKGTALERLRRLDEAIECYNQAIAADESMTIAYLYKGGLFNRMERFNDALECYEKALHTQENRIG
ncbi:MAG: hypothetical protein QOJ40_884 [Verrucomicrobiota bacterium]